VLCRPSVPSVSCNETDTRARADVCMIVEGGYPYVLGGVASWADAFIRASPQLTFHVIAITITSQSRRRSYVLPENVMGVTDILLDVSPRGQTTTQRDTERVERVLRLLQDTLTVGGGSTFEELVEQLRITGFGAAALLDSKLAWRAMERAYDMLLANGPLLDFFWTWRFLVRSVLAVVSTPLPQARVFHAVATGFAGLVGSYAKIRAMRPLLVTEHGIYTNERRIDLAVADWLFDSSAGGFDISVKPAELRSIWSNAFQSFSCITYAIADVVTTQYRANQALQRADGASDDKLRIIPNGIDAAKFASLAHEAVPRPPTVLMIGRIVPIKDVRTFIMAVAILRDIVPNVVAIIIGPEDEDSEYAASCRQLVDQLGTGSSIQFLGRVPDVLRYLVAADVLTLASISEAQPLALLEAAATGLPVVSTDVGSCREIIEGFDGDPVEGCGGSVVPPCNPKAMAEALATILLDDGMRSRMGEVMRRRAANYYHKDRVKCLYERLYAELMAQPAPFTDHRNHDQHQHSH
jgi:glycosyltransferase involved in cell wall biosynthesis